MNKTVPVLLIVVGAAAAADAQRSPDFSGTWLLNASSSKNLGVMATMQITERVTQSPTEVVINEQSSFQGQDQARELHYDLSGKPATNEGPMGDRCETVTRWVDGKLVTTWSSEGAVAGTKVVRTETRSLSVDGKTMSVESVRGANPPLTMVFEKK